MDEEGDHNVDDISAVSSVPTDLSISEISDLKFDLPGKKATKKKHQKERDKIARIILEKKQLEHDLQLVKIDLNQKEYLLENIKTEYSVKLEEVEEQLQQCKHQKQILVARSESQLALHQEESKKKQDRLHADLVLIKSRLGDLETVNANLMQKTADIKQQLKEHTDINEDKYYELRALADDALTVKDLVAMKIFESLRPYKFELDDLKSRHERLQSNYKESEDKLSSIRQELEDERQNHSANQIKLNRLSNLNQDLEVKATSKDYRINNYDKINKERDDFEKLLKEYKEKNVILERELSSIDREKKHVDQEYTAVKSSLALVSQDKEYLSRQVCELTNKLAYAEDRLQRLTSELEDVKRSREELFEKYVASRDHYKMHYEQQLQTELKRISLSTQEEIEKLRATTRAMYEMEARTLRESRDISLAERDKAIAQETELQNRYHQLNDLYRQEKVTLETKVSELTSQMKLAEYEKSRTALLQEETSKNLKDCQQENEKLLRKLEVTSKEYYNLELQLTKRVTESQSAIKEYQTRLQAYENIEKELDEIILQAAEVDTDEAAEKVMLSYGYGASIPSSSQRRMKQTVHVARRCLALERQMVADKKMIKEQEEAIETLKSQLTEAQNKMEAAEQPYSYILNKAQEYEAQVRELKKANHTLTVDLSMITKKYQEASADLMRLSQDLELSTRHRDEISFIKEELTNILRKPVLKSSSNRSNQLTVKEKVVKARNLLQQNTASALIEAEELLRSAQIIPNPATQVRLGELLVFDAILYLDSLLQLKSNMEHKRSSMKSQPLSLRPMREAENDIDANENPAPISIRRRSAQGQKRAVSKK